MAPKRTSSGLKKVAGATVETPSSSSSSCHVRDRAPIAEPINPQDDAKGEFIRAIAATFPGQETTIPSSESPQDLVQKLENAVNQIISFISLGQGTYTEFDIFISNGLEAIRRTGSDSLAGHCAQKLVHLKDSLYRLEWLMSSDPREGMEQLLDQARMRGAWEREVRRRDIQDQETFFAHLLTRRTLLQAEMDTSISTIAHLRTQLSSLRAVMDAPASVIARFEAGIAEEESTLENLLFESAEAHSAVTEAMETLEELHQHDSAETASFEARIQKDIEDQVQADRPRAIAVVKADLASFGLK